MEKKKERTTTVERAAKPSSTFRSEKTQQLWQNEQRISDAAVMLKEAHEHILAMKKKYFGKVVIIADGPKNYPEPGTRGIELCLSYLTLAIHELDDVAFNEADEAWSKQAQHDSKAVRHAS